MFLSALTFTGLSIIAKTHAAENFDTGPLIKDFGSSVSVEQTYPVSSQQTFKVVFDFSELTDPQIVHGNINSAARFLNMHVRAGVEAKNIQLALVVHGDASNSLLKDERYQAKYQRNNPNKKLLEALLKHQVRVILCGQTAAYHKITSDDLVEGAEIALSAMTANALLQQQGYTLNPF